jgi:hypothetical protein
MMKILLVSLGIFLAIIQTALAQEQTQTLTIHTALNLSEDVEGYYEALDPSFALEGNSRICPSNNCRYEFTDGVLNDFGDGILTLTGILNIIKDTGEKIPVRVWGYLL